MKNGIEYFDLFFGLAKCGAIIVPINNRLAPPELAAVLADSGARVLVTDPEYADTVSRACDEGPGCETILTGGSPGGYDELLAKSSSAEPMVEAFDDDELAIIYAGWEAGKPRGVSITHNNFFWSAATMTGTLHELGKSFLLALPFFHIGGLGWLPFFMHRGMRCVLMPRFDAEQFLDLVESEKITSFGAVPTMLKFLKESPGFKDRDFSRVQTILAYGQAVPADMIREYAGYGIKVRQLYGLTESAGPVLVIDGANAVEKAGSCGLPFFHTRVKLVDDLGQEVPVGEVGEVLIEAGHVMKCYWDRPQATEDALRGGWLYTGDLARRDEDGYYYIVERKKELVISGGENISPAEIESVIFEHPGVADVAVIGVHDETWGEAPKAVVVKSSRAPDLTDQDIIDFCQGKLAGYKIPREIEFVDSLPRTLTGKMEKRKLRKK